MKMLTLAFRITPFMDDLPGLRTQVCELIDEDLDEVVTFFDNLMNGVNVDDWKTGSERDWVAFQSCFFYGGRQILARFVSPNST
jgi:hypothetical protein